ncbi:hypothetical protein [Buchnera aphidicola]|uniref:Penicillin-binding protein activator LpoB n=1 Tax=Buchnera aphidicola (Macrosiphum gaurae) TaxID=2315801 RepID=A0A4D6XZ21_9GAMM|nr:hypothetical protein [Buchnera aphidicola]QCI22802.1 hypothetical protein D9V72_01820 [Buchnera aphidicola (Macrosiphum gaurae)]
MSKNLLSILFFIFFIHGCNFSKEIKKDFTKTKTLNFTFLNFDSTTENIISEILKSKNIFIANNTLFFIDLLKNETDMFIDTKKLTDSIKNKIIKKNHTISFLKKEIIEKNKKELGVLKNKNTLDTSTALLLSRNNHAKYYLYSCISGKNKLFSLEIKLILVKTGEIVFMKKEKLY